MIETRIITKAEIDSVVSLCCEVQDIHISSEPEIFKPLDRVKLKKWFEGLMDGGRSTVLVASKNGIDVGYLLLKLVERNEDLFHYSRRLMEIDQICVTRFARNSGVGTVLVDTARDISKEAGIDQLELNVWSFNAEARRVFDQLGFIPVSERLQMTI